MLDRDQDKDKDQDQDQDQDRGDMKFRLEFDRRPSIISLYQVSSLIYLYVLPDTVN